MASKFSLKIHPKSILVILICLLIQYINTQTNNTLDNVENSININNNNNFSNSDSDSDSDSHSILTTILPDKSTSAKQSFNNNSNNNSNNDNNNNNNSVNITSNNNNDTIINDNNSQTNNNNTTYREPINNINVVFNEDLSHLNLSSEYKPNKDIIDKFKGGTLATTCDGYKILDYVLQPKYSDFAKIKKCCNLGEYYQNSTALPRTCAKENFKFNVPVIQATFYEDCIEDSEEFVKLDYEIGNPCTNAYEYSPITGDILYVLQNGSLLRVEETFDTYDIFDEYCLDMHDENVVIAIVCIPNANGKMIHVSKAQSYIYAICMLTSVPCLLATVFFYVTISRLRNLHGKSLAAHSFCLAIGFVLLSISQFNANIGQVTGYLVQYFILACFFWLAVMCIDICVHVWWFVPKSVTLGPKVRLSFFLSYAIISMGIPLILVLITLHKQLPGTPSYYLKGITETTRSSQQFFIPPISTLLIICLALLITSYFGFRQLQEIATQSFLIRMKHEHDPTIKGSINYIAYERFEEVKQVAKSTSYLYAIMTINWVFEIISFYHHSTSESLVLFDILNALQGVVIFIIFVCLKYPLNIIKQWWMDRGSLDLNMTELQLLNNGAATTTTTTTTTTTEPINNNK